MEKKRVLVTGCAGFMGSHIAEALTKTYKYDVYGVDDLSGGLIDNVPNDCHFTKLDLRNREEAKELVNRIKPDYIYALAANAREGASYFSPRDVAERNVNVLINVLEPAIANNLKKIVYFSSMSVYGGQKSPFEETMERNPVDPYGKSKDWCEEVIEQLSGAHGFNYVIIRPHNVMGERQCLSDVFRNCVAIFMNRIMRGEPIYIYGDGEQKRAFSYIDFSLPCYLRCLDDDINNDIFNIGGMIEVTINEMAQMVIDCFPTYVKPEIIHLPDRHGEVKNAWSTYQKSVDILGYKETFDLKEAVRRMSEWAKLKGPQEWTEEKLPLINEKVPKTWTMPRKKQEVSE